MLNKVGDRVGDNVNWEVREGNVEYRPTLYLEERRGHWIFASLSSAAAKCSVRNFPGGVKNRAKLLVPWPGSISRRCCVVTPHSKYLWFPACNIFVVGTDSLQGLWLSPTLSLLPQSSNSSGKLSQIKLFLCYFIQFGISCQLSVAIITILKI